MEREPVEPAKEPKNCVLVGQVVAFDLHRKGGKITREKGQVIEQRWLGVTVRGRIPEWELVIAGRTASVLARLTADHVQPLD